MAVAAEFEIQSEMKQVTMTNPKCKLVEESCLSFEIAFRRSLTASDCSPLLE